MRWVSNEERKESGLREWADKMDEKGCKRETKEGRERQKRRGSKERRERKRDERQGQERERGLRWMR